MSHKASIIVTPGSERSFGVVFAAVFLIVGLFPLLGAGEVRYWSLGIAAAFVAVSLLRPSLFKRPNYWWFRFGMMLGSVVAPIVMALVYVTTIVPTGLVVRLAGKDLLKLKLDRDADTYWVERDTPMQPMKNQF